MIGIGRLCFRDDDFCLNLFRVIFLCICVGTVEDVWLKQWEEAVAQCLYPVVFMDEICKRRVRIVKHTLDVADMCGLSFYVSRCKYDGQKVQYDEHWLSRKKGCFIQSEYRSPRIREELHRVQPFITYDSCIVTSFATGGWKRRCRSICNDYYNMTAVLGS